MPGPRRPSSTGAEPVDSVVCDSPEPRGSPEGAVCRPPDQTNHRSPSRGDDVEKGVHAEGKDSIDLPISDHEPDSLLFDRPEDFPEGGWHAWLNVFAGCWGLFFSFGLANTFGVFEEYYLDTVLSHKSSSQVAWIGSFQYGFIFFLGPFVGRLFDAGYLCSVYSVGAAFFVVCHMLLSLCTEYYQIFLAQGVGVSLGCGLLFNCSTMAPGHWFLKRRAFALGITQAGSSLGGTILPIMVRKLIEHPNVGYAWTMRIIGFMGLALFIPSIFSLRQRLQPKLQLTHGGWKRVHWIYFGAFKSWAFVLLTAGAFFIFLTMYNLWTYLQLFTTQNKIPKGPYFLSVVNGASTFGRIITGALADKAGRFNMLIPMCAVAGIILLIWPLANNLGGIIPASILYGVSSGCFVSVLPSCLGQIGPTGTIGARIGTSYFFLGFGGLFGTPIGGAILGNSNDRWWPLMGYSGAVVLLGTALIFCSRQVVTKGRLISNV